MSGTTAAPLTCPGVASARAASRLVAFGVTRRDLVFAGAREMNISAHAKETVLLPARIALRTPLALERWTPNRVHGTHTRRRWLLAATWRPRPARPRRWPPSSGPRRVT